MAIKVLFALDEFPGPFGGTETQFLRLLSGLQGTDIKPTVLLLRASSYLEKHRPDIPIRVLGIERMASPAAIYKSVSAALWAKSQKFQIVHTFFNDASILMPWAMRLVGIPVLISRRDEGYWCSKKLIPFLRLNRIFVHGIVANSAVVAESVQKLEGYCISRIHVIHNGIASESTLPTIRDSRASMAVPESEFVFSVLANLRPLKRVDDIIKAFSRFASGKKNVSLLIGGEDQPGRESLSHRAELEALVASLGMEEKIRFLGPIDNAEAFVVASDCGLLCSETEGLSNSIMQFMKAGVPVIVSDAGGNPELVGYGDSGLIVQVGDCDGIAAAMSLVFSKTVEVGEMAARGRDRMLREFRSERMISAHVSLYRNVVGLRGNRKRSAAS